VAETADGLGDWGWNEVINRRASFDALANL